MFNTLKKRIKNEKGLSLVELLAVIVIMAIIAAIAIPAIGNIINTSRDKGQVSDALNIIAGGKLAHIELNCGKEGCTADNLKAYVDGIDVSDITVSLNDKSEWVISGYTFEFKTTKFSGIGKSPTEMELKKALDPDAKVEASESES